jgi:hypothetical protein
MLEIQSFRIHNADDNTYMTIDGLPNKTPRFVSLNERMSRLEKPKITINPENVNEVGKRRF